MELTPEMNFEKLGLVLPPLPKVLGVYKPCYRIGNLIHFSGHGPLLPDSTMIKGRVGDNLTQEEGKAAAQQVGLALLSTLRNYLGSLNRIKRVVKVFGMVSCTPEFDQHPYVINGCSELFAKIWGDDLGVGVRCAVGMGSLPEGIPVEIEALMEYHAE